MRRIVALSLFMLAVAGCGGPRTGKVAGRVLCDDKPLQVGRVTFLPADPAAESVSVELDAEGRFSVVLPVGEVTACVDNREWAPKAPRGAITLPNLPPEVKDKVAAPAVARTDPRYVRLPPRYHQMESAELKFTVKPGEQVWEMRLRGE